MLVRAKSVPRACNLESNRMGETPVRNYMYLKKICVNGGLVEYHCKSKSQAKRWLRSQGLTQQATSAWEDSFSFITPLEPACVLVYTPGRYRFLDFVKIGSILTIIVFVVAMLLVPIFWPFHKPL